VTGKADQSKSAAVGGLDQTLEENVFKRSRLVTLVFIGGLAISLMVAACGGATPASVATEAVQATEPEAEQATEPPQETDARRAYAGTEIRVIVDDVAPTTTMKQIIDDFTEETGIVVNLEVYDETTAREKIVLDLTSHTAAYDVVNLQWWFVPEYANGGFLVPIEELEAMGTDPVWYNPSDFAGSIVEGFRYEETLYGLPFWIIGGMYYYRTDILAENGWDTPATIQDVLAIAESTKQTYGEDMYGWIGRGNRDFDAFGSFAGFAAGYGVKLLDDGGNPTLLTEPAWEQAMTDWIALMRGYGPPGAGNLTWYDSYQLFEQGKIVQFFETSDYGPAFENPDESVVVGNAGYLPAPVGPAGEHAQWFYAEGLGVNRDSTPEKQAAAWLFLQWRTSAETFAKELRVDDSPRFDVPSTSVLNSEDYQIAAEEAGMVAYAEGLRDTLLVADPWYWPFVPEFAQVAEAFASEVSGALSGDATAAQVLERAQVKIEDILK